MKGANHQNVQRQGKRQHLSQRKAGPGSEHEEGHAPHIPASQQMKRGSVERRQNEAKGDDRTRHSAPCLLRRAQCSTARRIEPAGEIAILVP